MEHDNYMKKIIYICYFLLGVLLILLIFCLNSFGDGILHVYFLDIGQGDAILIKTPDSEYILVDGGPNDKILQELSSVMPFYERTIDVLVLTHPHADHINGLVEVIERYNVRQVVITGIHYGYAGYGKFLELINENGIQVIFVDGSSDYKLNSVFFDFIFPMEGIQGERFENINNSSVVFRLLYGNTSFFLSGDLEIEAESKLVESGLDLRADVMKAGHHGSRTSTSESILDKVLPEISVISCGVDNPFDHPHAETIQHLQKRGIKIFRTDLDGRVELRSDGKEIFTPQLS